MDQFDATNHRVDLRDTTIAGIAEVYPKVIADLRKFDFVRSAATFGGLLARPELQANCFRLETLVHLAIVYCNGNQAPSTPLVQRCFEAVGENYCGQMEDPAEDVFSALVNTPRGTFRIFEGLTEGNSFHLQIVLEVLESMPATPTYDRLRTAADSLLKLSNEVAVRAGIEENILGQEEPLNRLPKSVVNRLASGRDLVRFSRTDLARLGIPDESLTDFLFSLDSRTNLDKDELGNTSLERQPILRHGESVYLLLPTAVGSAIRRYVIDFVGTMGLERAFERSLARRFSVLFENMPLIAGGSAPVLVFRKIAGGRVASIGTEVDPGRHLHFIFFVDALDGYSEGGLVGTNPEPQALAEATSFLIEKAFLKAQADPGFLSGITLLVHCGFGRGLYLAFEEDVPANWRFEVLSAHDFATLSWLPLFERLSLWRLLDAQSAIERQGTILFNVNGLLNLVGWAMENDWHLTPHGQIPHEFSVSENNNLVVVTQNALRSVRHKVLTIWDPRRVLDSNGRWVPVRKLDPSFFEEDNVARLYGSVEDLQARKLRGVYVAKRRPWWIEVSSSDQSRSPGIYERWIMLCTWLRRLAPVLDEAFPGLIDGPISIRVRFAEIVEAMTGPVSSKRSDQMRDLIDVSIEKGKNQIEISISQGFDDGLFHPNNVAERSLIEAFVAGVAKAAGEMSDQNKQELLVTRICPNLHARHMHRFEARSYRDILNRQIGRKPLLIDSLDYAACRIGLGWKVRPKTESPEIHGVPECNLFLNGVVQVLLDDIVTLLQELDRKSIVHMLLMSHEAAAHDRDVWRRTAKANVAMHEDREATLQTIIAHDSQLSVCFLTSRVLLEAALCECPIQGGRKAGRLDLSRLMSRAMIAFEYGGWSDAIRWGVMEPRVKITALGDVHMNLTFLDDVYKPFATAGGRSHIASAMSRYEKLYAAENTRTVAEVFDSAFLMAWEAEFSVSLEGTLGLVARLEELGVARSEPIFTMQRSALLSMISSVVSVGPIQAASALEMLTLVPRPEWRVAPLGFEGRDWHPWRFRRRLSVMRRPFLQIDETSDPPVVIAPGLVRDALFYIGSQYQSGEVAQWQARSDAMRSWLGHANRVQRSEFNSEVARRMQELGWNVMSEVSLPTLLGKALDKNFGDIDVLAWRATSGRVLAIECKDLQYQKTIGEVAAQLADYRGEMKPNGKPDDLRRHLDRIDVLRANPAVLEQKVGLAEPLELEAHLVFRNTVPMKFAWDQMAARIRLSLFSELERL